MTVSQLLVWTALPAGRSSRHGGTLTLSVFLAPQLTATVPPGHSFAPLSLFPDFVDWPRSISTAPDGPITFTVTFDGPHGLITVPASDVTDADLDVSASAAWKAIFDPATTQVEPFTFQDYSTRTVHSFPVNQIANFVSSIYGTIGATSPSEPILLNSTLEPRDNERLAVIWVGPTSMETPEPPMSLRYCSSVLTKSSAPRNVGWPTLTWMLLLALDDAVKVAPGVDPSDAPKGIWMTCADSRMVMVKASTTPWIWKVVDPLGTTVIVAVSVNMASDPTGANPKVGTDTNEVWRV